MCNNNKKNYNADYYAKNKDIINAKRRKKYNDNPEFRESESIRNSNYYKKNSENIKAKSNNYYNENREEILSEKREFNQKYGKRANPYPYIISRI